MKAVCWYGAKDMRVETVPDPKIINKGDVIIKTTLTAICGSDLHIYDGTVMGMEKGDIVGHEFMGEVVEVGSSIKNLKIGDRVTVPFTISCGRCFFCEQQLFSVCDNSNPRPLIAEKSLGQRASGLFGYSKQFGGYAGGQAKYVRIPYADYGPIKIPEGLTDEQVVFLSDIFPTGFMAVEQCGVKEGDSVAIWGCGPVGQMAIKSAQILGAHKVIAIDPLEYRRNLAEKQGALVVDSTTEHLVDVLREMTGGRGPDICVDAVGYESHGDSFGAIYDTVKTTLKMTTDRAQTLRQAIFACRKGGTVSIPGVYIGFADKVPTGALMNKALTIKTGQTHMQKYMPRLLKLIQEGVLDPSFVISHRMPLEKAPDGYKMFYEKRDECTKVVLLP